MAERLTAAQLTELAQATQQLDSEPARRRLPKRCDTCGRVPCTCETRLTDEAEWDALPRHLTREDARELGVDL